MRKTIFAMLFVVCAVAVAQAQYSSDYESVVASDTGVILTGQDGYYIPGGTSSIDYLAYKYAGNALGIAANPNGGEQFVAGTGPGPDMAGTLFFARAQRDVSYAGPDVWTTSMDVCIVYTGVLPSAQNIGSFSTQLFPGQATFIQLVRWTDPNTAANWNADFVWYPAVGAALTEAVPDAAFQNLLTNHWYRRSATFDFATNQILEVSVTDLTTGTTATYNPPDRYLEGGAAGGLPRASGFRLFAGGSVAGNTLAFDNVDIAPASTGGCVPPASYTVFRGIQRSGDLGSFADADGNVATFNPGFTINNSEAPVWLVFDANAPNATDISVTSTAGTPGIGVRAECWNWSTSMYVQVGHKRTKLLTFKRNIPLVRSTPHALMVTATFDGELVGAKRDLRSTSHG